VFDRAAQIAARDAARRDAMRATAEADRLSKALAAAQARVVELEAAAAADRTMGGLVKDRLVVFLGDGGAFDGLLLDNDGRTLTFADVHRRGQDSVTAAAPGELYIDRGRVLYMQRLATDQSRGE
jgi:hypothetical protein